MSGATATRATGCSWRRSSGSSAPAGAPWRDLPERFGDWKNTHKRYSRWAESGVWESLFKTLADDPDNEYAMIDATVVRAHQHSAGARKKGIRTKRSAARAED